MNSLQNKFEPDRQAWENNTLFYYSQDEQNIVFIAQEFTANVKIIVTTKTCQAYEA
jgi:hypothetical protein